MSVETSQAVTHLLTAALAHSQAGRLHEAAIAYRQLLLVVPDHATANYNLAVTLKGLGRLDEAAAQYQRTLIVKPDNPKAHNNLGAILTLQGKDHAAAAHYERALVLQPHYANAHYNYANLLRKRGEIPRAITHYWQALLSKPDDAEIRNNLGIALVANGQGDEAILQFQQALALRPDYAEAYSNLGSAFEDQGRTDESLACFNMALELKPAYADAHCNLGRALHAQDRLAEAELHYELALALDPTHAESHNNFGFLSQQVGRIDVALARYGRAQELKPNYADAHWNEALARLLSGDFAAGWRKYEWRWRRKETPPRIFAVPLWDGGDLTGKTILLHAEQGYGDAIQFIRYAALVKKRGGLVLVECSEPLRRLFASAPGIDRLVSADEPFPLFDCHAPLLSLPAILGTMLETIPADTPYLRAESDLVQKWRNQFSQPSRRKIGLAWRGNPTHSNDRKRSIPATAIADLGRMAGIELISLQVDTTLDEIAAFSPVILYNMGSSLHDWADTAALVEALDLVITVDTSIAHLAGALGKPVWVLLPFAPDWRWLLDRCDSPWYPTMRLFRQHAPGDWTRVLKEIRAALGSVSIAGS
ncbi:MAG: glycosyl transferase family 9 [Rhodospirillales bacterium]|nr:glycosyl transferase family 9 [Rhodospirillales bacterium]